GNNANHVAQHHAKTVIEGHRDAEPVLPSQPHRSGTEVGIVDNVVMGQGRPFWHSGSARGVLDIDGIVKVQAAFAAAQLRLRNLLDYSHEPLPRLHPLWRMSCSEKNHMLEMRKCFCLDLIAFLVAELRRER